ncbi:MAG: NYN domain-containing protein [Protaetiibacter sp.]
MPDHHIGRVHYFTARIKVSLGDDAQSPLRQQIYLRALVTDPRVTVHFGKFRIDPRPYPVHPAELDPDTGKLKTVMVRRPEEKGSDVNLATRMLSDAFQNGADHCVVLTNDSDQVGPLLTMKQEFGKAIGIIFPMASHRSSKELYRTGPDFVGHVTREDLLASQFPTVLRDGVGEFRRPAAW